jgi:Zn-dependent M28 family amino/carboxypeptidase
VATEPDLSPPSEDLAARARDAREQLDPAGLRAELERLPGPRNRLRQPDAAEATLALVRSRFEEHGWATERQEFDLKEMAVHFSRVLARWFPEATGANVLATKHGVYSDDIVLVGAHHDTLPETPGADDNGAGLVALCELARMLATRRLRHTLVLAAFDFEEVGFHGARAFVRSLPAGRRVLGALVFETMAFTARDPGSQEIPPGLGALFPRQVRRIRERGSKGDWTAVIYRASAQDLAVRFAQAHLALDGPDSAMLLRDPADLPAVGPALKRVARPIRNFARSDHVPFWEEGHPAIQITDTANFRNPHYHRPSDTPDTVDYERLATVIAASAVTVEDVASIVAD